MSQIRTNVVWKSATLVVFAMVALVATVMVIVTVEPLAALAMVMVAVVAASFALVVAIDFPLEVRIAVSIIVIILSLISLFQTIPIALNSNQTIEVICQQTTTQTAIFIHASTTQTITYTSVVNKTVIQPISKVSCP